MPRARQPKPGQQLALDLPGVKPPKQPRITGTVLNRWIVEHLRMRGAVAWRNNVGGAVFGEGEDQRYVQFGFKGMSDVMGFIGPNARTIAVEGKVEDDLSPEQRGFLDLVKSAGGIALVVHPGDYQQLIDDALDVPASKRWTRQEGEPCGQRK